MLAKVNAWKVQVFDENDSQRGQKDFPCADDSDSFEKAESLSERYHQADVIVTNGGHHIRTYKDGKVTSGLVLA